MNAMRLRRAGAGYSTPGVLLLLALAASLSAADLEPLWSRPLPAAPVSAVVRTRPDGREELLLLFEGGWLAVASEAGKLRELGRLPPGFRAVAALPGHALVAAGREALVAVDDSGRVARRWRAPADFDSLWLSGAAAGGAARFVAWRDGTPYLLELGDSVFCRRLDFGFRPLSSTLVDLDADGWPEFIATDGAGFALADCGHDRVLVQALGRLGGTGVGGRLVAAVDVDRDSAGEILVLTDQRDAGFDTLRCLDAATVRQRWAVGAGGASALAAVGSRPCLAVVGPNGALVLRLLEPDGRVNRDVELPASARLLGLAALGRRPLASLRFGSGPSGIRLLSPGLEDSRFESPGYSGVAWLRAFPVRLDADSFPDLLVVRTSADAGWRIDAFRNRLGALAGQLAVARRLAAELAAAGDDVGMARAQRRAQLLAERVELPEEAPTESELRLRVRVRRRRLVLLGLLATLAAVGMSAAGLVTLLRFRRRRYVRAIEELPLSVRAALATDLVAVDHNFVSKGNWPAAAERLRELRAVNGLERDIDMARIEKEVEPWYSGAVGRLVEATSTEPLLELVVATARLALRAAPADVPVVEVTRGDLRRQPPPPGTRIVCIRNREYPDIYARLRLLSSPKLRSLIEHVIVDHFAYAAREACIVIDYSVSTQWNRRVTVRLFSDSLDRIDLTRRDGHLVSQLAELHSVLRPAVEIPGPDWRPETLGVMEEKLWMRFADLVSVLEETRARLRPEAGR